jgi:hypothetical protein
MNILSREKQIEVVSALTEGLGIRATARITGVNRETVGKIALQVGRGAAELHDRMMVGLRVNRIEGLAAFDPPAASLMRATCLQNRRKPMTRRITCITKHPNHEDRHRRIQAVGGYGWKDSEDTAIANVKRDPSAYEVTEQGKTVKVIVKKHDGRDYLKTENDRFLPDNLLSLQEC